MIESNQYVNITIDNHSYKFKGYSFEDSFPTTKGIYGLICLKNNKYIIGLTNSKKGFRNRWGSYKCNLRQNKYVNKYLQNTFNKYKEENFRFFIVEENPTSDLQQLEIAWIKRLKSTVNEFGLNITAGGETPTMVEETKQKISHKLKGFVHSKSRNKKILLNKLGKRKSIVEREKQPLNKAYKYKQFISDDNSKGIQPVLKLINFKKEIVVVYDKAAFCRLNKINYSQLSRVINGRRFSFYGWTLHTENIEKLTTSELETLWNNRHLNQWKIKTYTILTPSDEIIEITNLKQFCNENLLDYQRIHDIVNDKESYYTHKGYKNINFKKNLTKRLEKYDIT